MDLEAAWQRIAAKKFLTDEEIKSEKDSQSSTKLLYCSIITLLKLRHNAQEEISIAGRYKAKISKFF